MPKVKQQLTDSAAAGKLQMKIFLCSILFTIGTAIHNFIIITPSLIETMMQMAGVADPAGEAIGLRRFQLYLTMKLLIRNIQIAPKL